MPNSISTTTNIKPKSDLPERNLPVRDIRDTSGLPTQIKNIVSGINTKTGLTFDRVSIFDFNDLPDYSENLRHPGVVVCAFFTNNPGPGNVYLTYVNGETYQIISEYEEVCRAGFITRHGMVILKTNTRKTTYDVVAPTQENPKPELQPKEVWIHRILPNPDSTTWKEIDLSEYKDLQIEAYKISENLTLITELG